MRVQSPGRCYRNRSVRWIRLDPLLGRSRAVVHGVSVYDDSRLERHEQLG